MRTRLLALAAATATLASTALADPAPGLYRARADDVVECQDPTVLPLVRREVAWLNAHHQANDATSNALTHGNCLVSVNVNLPFTVMGVEPVRWHARWFDGHWDGGVELEARAKLPFGDGTYWYFYVAAADIVPVKR